MNFYIVYFMANKFDLIWFDLMYKVSISFYETWISSDLFWSTHNLWIYDTLFISIRQSITVNISFTVTVKRSDYKQNVLIAVNQIATVQSLNYRLLNRENTLSMFASSVKETAIRPNQIIDQCRKIVGLLFPLLKDKVKVSFTTAQVTDYVIYIL